MSSNNYFSEAVYTDVTLVIRDVSYMHPAINTHLFDLPTELIPERLQEISSYCGQQTALVLLLNFPGLYLRIPKKPNPLHKLAEFLDMPAFVKLCETFGDEILLIPRAAKAIRAVRNQHILAEFAQGKTQGELAIKYGMTQHQIGRICNAVAIDRRLDILNDFDSGISQSDIATKYALSSRKINKIISKNKPPLTN